MADVTLAAFDEMEPIYDGLARRARAALGVTAWGMQLFALPPGWDGYPDHVHDATVEDANQEEVYIPLEGSAELWAGGGALRAAARGDGARRARAAAADRARRGRHPLHRARRRAGSVQPFAVDRGRRPLAGPAVGSRGHARRRPSRR